MYAYKPASSWCVSHASRFRIQPEIAMAVKKSPPLWRFK